MRFHLYTTDVSGFALLRQLPEGERVSAVVVPANRATSDKVKLVCRESPWPVVVHHAKDGLPEETPKADYFVSWFYSQIISRQLLATYAKGGINMHGGRIPDYRGANVLNWAIANGETHLGVTWHEVVEKVDAGGILAESSIPVATGKAAIDLRTDIINEGVRLFPEAMQRFVSGGPPLRVPDLNCGRIWPSRRAEDSRIEPRWSIDRVDAMIRAQTGPWPDATVFDNGEWRSIVGFSSDPVPDGIPYQTDRGQEIYLVPKSGPS